MIFCNSTPFQCSDVRTVQCVSFPSLWQNVWDRQFPRRVRLFWLLVWGVTVLNNYLTLGPGKRRHIMLAVHGRRSPHLVMMTRHSLDSCLIRSRQRPAPYSWQPLLTLRVLFVQVTMSFPNCQCWKHPSAGWNDQGDFLQGCGNRDIVAGATERTQYWLQWRQLGPRSWWERVEETSHSGHSRARGFFFFFSEWMMQT